MVLDYAGWGFAKPALLDLETTFAYNNNYKIKMKRM